MCMQQMSSTIFQRAHSLKKIYVMGLPTQRRNEYAATSAIDGSITDVLDLMKHHHLTHFLL